MLRRILSCLLLFVLIGVAGWWGATRWLFPSPSILPSSPTNQAEVTAAPQSTPNILTLLPKLGGYGQPKTYLVIMQNNDELRPTGGFIGVYGIFTISNGTLTDWTTADSYALDRPAEGYLRVTPPDPIATYMDTDRWWFRDANWSPDWPTAAEKLLWFYQQERGTGNPTAVVAFDPTVIEQLLTLTGPITIDDTTFTADTFTDALQYQVELAYVEQGLPKSERKAIVATLAETLLQRVRQLPIRDWFTATRLLERSLQQKHILLYDRDTNVQSEIVRRGWGGDIKSVTGDYVLVVDSNMVARKTDRVVERDIRYQVMQHPLTGKTIALVTVHYRHQAPHDYRTSRLRTYVRVYAPLGSTLLGVWGAKPNDRDPDMLQPLPPDVIDEMEKTSFGVFTTVEPLQEQTLIFEYQLPDYLYADFVRTGRWPLYIQKQPGTSGHDLDVRVELDGSQRHFSGTLATDQALSL